MNKNKIKKAELDGVMCELSEDRTTATFEHPELDAGGTTRTTEYITDGKITHRGQRYSVRTCEMWRAKTNRRWRLFKVD